MQNLITEQITTLSGSENIDSQQLLLMVNETRKEYGEPTIRNNKFIEKVKDELEGEYYTKSVVQKMNNTESEVWKSIAGFEERYEVSNKGQVRSISRTVPLVSKAGRKYYRNIPGKILSPGNCRGYLIVNVFPYGTIAIHRLVAFAFVKGYRPGFEVNHIDGIKVNNNAHNLEWVSHSQNQNHAVSIGLKSQAIKVKNPYTGQTFPSIRQAARTCRVAHRTASKWKIKFSGSTSKLTALFP